MIHVRDIDHLQRISTNEWFEENDIPRGGIFEWDLDLIDMPVIVIHRYLKDDEGRHIIKPGTGTDDGWGVEAELMTTEEHYLLKVGPPKWWPVQPQDLAA